MIIKDEKPVNVHAKSVDELRDLIENLIEKDFLPAEYKSFFNNLSNSLLKLNTLNSELKLLVESSLDYCSESHQPEK
jgi:hypothetical protein